jgi:transporter family-2 protein
MSAIVAAILGSLAGIGIAVQVTVNSVLLRGIGILPSTFIVHLVGMIVLLLPLLLFHQFSTWHKWNTIPWYAYMGGVLGVFIVPGISYLVGAIGVTSALSIVLAAQLIAALVIDYFGWFGAAQQSIDLVKILGVVLLLVGVRLVLK